MREEKVTEEMKAQVVKQCDAVVRLATSLAQVHSDFAALLSVGASDGMYLSKGKHTAHLMEVLGDILNGMDAVDAEDADLAPVFRAAQAMFPQVRP